MSLGTKIAKIYLISIYTLWVFNLLAKVALDEKQVLGGPALLNWIYQIGLESLVINLWWITFLPAFPQAGGSYNAVQAFPYYEIIGGILAIASLIVILTRSTKLAALPYFFVTFSVLTTLWTIADAIIGMSLASSVTVPLLNLLPYALLYLLTPITLFILTRKITQNNKNKVSIP